MDTFPRPYLPLNQQMFVYGRALRILDKCRKGNDARFTSGCMHQCKKVDVVRDGMLRCGRLN